MDSGPSATRDGAWREYCSQLAGMAAWQAGMWLFGLLVVSMMVAARGRAFVSGVEGYARVSGRARLHRLHMPLQSFLEMA